MAGSSYWYGVNVENGHVTQLSLEGINLVGTIPSSLGNLTYLQDLDLGANRLSGSIRQRLATSQILRN